MHTTGGRFAVLAAATAAALQLLTAGANAQQQPDAGLGIRLVDAPVDRRDDPRASVYVVDHVSPGTDFQRRVEVVNDTPEPMTVDVYPTAAEVGEAGFASLPGRQENELTDWMSVDRDRLVLGPRERSVVTVAFAVPNGAPEGERYASVMAEVPGSPSADGVSVARRVGVRVYLAVGPGGEAASDFEVSTLTPQRLEDGTPVVTARVTNTGGRALDMSGALELTNGPGGLRAGPFPVDVRAIGIGATGDVSMTLDSALPAGPWQAKLVMRSGRIEKAVEATITFPEAGTVGPRVTAEPIPLAQDPSVVIPVAIGLLVLAVLLLLWALWRRRRKDGRDEQQPAVEPVVPAARRSADDAVRS